MSFTTSDLSVLAYANNFTLWHYVTTDKNVTGEGYFNGAVDMLPVNDLIIVNEDTDGKPITNYYVVTKSDGTTVGISLYQDQKSVGPQEQPEQPKHDPAKTAMDTLVDICKNGEYGERISAAGIILSRTPL